jgi:hypothetical protein
MAMAMRLYRRDLNCTSNKYGVLGARRWVNEKPFIGALGECLLRECSIQRELLQL